MTDDTLRAALEDVEQYAKRSRAHPTTYRSGVLDKIGRVRAALAASATDEGPPEGTRLVLFSEELALALGADRVEWGEPDEHGWYTPTVLTRPAVPEALDVDIFRQAAIEAHVWSPDHESGDFPCRYEPCRKRYAALRSKEPA